jgi:hypothetical protein
MVDLQVGLLVDYKQIHGQTHFANMFQVNSQAGSKQIPNRFTGGFQADL